MATAAAVQQLSFLVIGGGTDAPGIEIVPDGHGGWKIVHVPGWNPEQMLELSSLAKAVAAAGRIRNPEVSGAILKAAGGLVQKELGGIVGAERGGTVVIVT